MGTPLLDVNSELAVTDHDKADILNAQFTSIFTVDDGILPQVETRTQRQLSDINLSPEVIRKFMCKLPKKFSRSPDGIPSAVLRSLWHRGLRTIITTSRSSRSDRHSVFVTNSALPTLALEQYDLDC